MSDQYKHMHKGDVARRMNLQKHAAEMRSCGERQPNAISNIPRDSRRIRAITPARSAAAYLHNCFKYHYYGPSVFRGRVLVSALESVDRVVVGLPLPSVLGSPPALVPAGDLRAVHRLELVGAAGLAAVARGGLRHLGRCQADRRRAGAIRFATPGGSHGRSRPSRGKTRPALPRLVPQQQRRADHRAVHRDAVRLERQTFRRRICPAAACA